MITLKLSGGLGNQMFQYAVGKALSIKHNTDLIIDDSFIKNRFPQKNLTYRNDELYVFGIEEKINSISQIVNKFTILNKIIHPYFYDLINKLIYRNNYIKEINGKFIENIGNNVYLDGYWQTAKYFEKYDDEIKEIFQVKTEISKKNQEIINLIEKNYLNTVSVHIRRGDYITNVSANSWHGTCNSEYYNKALQIMKEKIQNPYFIIFSDDIKWVKENMNFGKNSLFIDNNSGQDDLRLMAHCAHHIIANSSFSWWGAYLGKNPDKTIIAPSKWLNNNDYDISNILPNNWLKI